ncbi:MAG: hypothetical protein ACQEXQ_24370 [Bacillota bacterium]
MLLRLNKDGLSSKLINIGLLFLFALFSERENLHEWAVNMDNKGKLAAYMENHK